jgi:16S rRNA (cytosine1402-N4)-methyltransferase
VRTKKVSNNFKHEPVLLNEAVEALNIKNNGVYIDATFGRGGHSAEILKQLGSKGRLLLIDKDPLAIAFAKEKYKEDGRVFVWQGSFKDFPDALKDAGLEKADGLLLDLGVSSPQLDDPGRGFSFINDGPLDMRMNADTGMSAAQWLATTSEAEIVRVLFEYGEERFARRIAAAIVKDRVDQPFQTTLQLAGLIARVVPMREKHKHPATRSFQAIRIEINQELKELQEGLMQAINILKPGGRLVVIAFHSLEDRIVKRLIRDESRGKYESSRHPLIVQDKQRLRLRKVGPAIRASALEVQQNKRARSAVLRVAERLE